MRVLLFAPFGSAREGAVKVGEWQQATLQREVHAIT
jgi:hypothetical protein